MKFLRTDRDLSELWLELGLEEDDGSGGGSLSTNNSENRRNSIDTGGGMKKKDPMSLIGANDGSIEFMHDPSSSLARPGMLIVGDDIQADKEASGNDSTSSNSCSSSPYSVLRGSAGDAAARQRMITSALEHARALAASPGAAGNVHVLKRIEVRRCWRSASL